MPTVELNNALLAYEDSGGSGPPLVMSHGLLLSKRQFDPLVDRWSGRWRCVAYDHRGQGESLWPTGGWRRSVTLDDCYADAVALIERLGLAPCHWLGYSMGGFVGLRLAARRPELLRSLTLVNSSAARQCHRWRYGCLNQLSRWFSRPLAARAIMQGLFSREYLRDPERRAERQVWFQRLLVNRPTIWRSVQGVLDRPAVDDQLAAIRLPTLVIAADQDQLTPLDDSRRIHQAIAGSRLVVLAGARHGALIERQAEVAVAVERFLVALEPLARDVP